MLKNDMHNLKLTVRRNKCWAMHPTANKVGESTDPCLVQITMERMKMMPDAILPMQTAYH